MRFCRFAILILLFLGIIPPVFGQTAAPILHRGLNLSNWLANATRQQMTERDFAQIKQAGFDHIRLPVDPELLGFGLDQKSSTLKFTAVDAALALAAKYHLAVILDVHPSLAFMDKLEKTPEAEANFITLWDRLAQHYDEKNYPPSMLAFELLNEPHYYHKEDHYRDMMQTIVAHIRKLSQQRTVIIGSPHSSSIDSLIDMQPLNDANIIYDFHFYEPYMVTHQGIHRGFEKKMLRYFHDVPYPAQLVDHDAPYYAADATNQGQAEKELQDYVQEGWDADVIARRIYAAKAWAAKYKVPIICGEFGVLRTHIDPQSRYHWIADTRKALDANNIGWDLWDYADLMGIVTFTGEVTAPDPNDNPFI
jgi:endoglucanase